MLIKFKSVDQTTVHVENVDSAYDQRSDSIYPPGRDCMSKDIKRLAIFDDLSPYRNDRDHLHINGEFSVSTFYCDGYRYFQATLNTFIDSPGWSIKVCKVVDKGNNYLEVEVPYDEVRIIL